VTRAPSIFMTHIRHSTSACEARATRRHSRCARMVANRVGVPEAVQRASTAVSGNARAALHCALHPALKVFVPAMPALHAWQPSVPMRSSRPHEMPVAAQPGFPVERAPESDETWAFSLFCPASPRPSGRPRTAAP
jgi:hypothetical protein